MVDPPRPESVRAVAEAKQAGIKTVMITGDHKVTATAIAKQIGIFEEGDLALTGMELDAMSEEELDQKIDKISVYARVSPENKIRIVEGWQRRGNIVSMTGDGVNDAPALAAADVGIAMGTGTDVAIESAGVTLLKGDLMILNRARHLSEITMKNIRQNLFFAFIYNALGVPVAAGLLYPVYGILLSPVIAAAAMALSSVSVIVNALRLKSVRLGK